MKSIILRFLICFTLFQIDLQGRDEDEGNFIDLEVGRQDYILSSKQIQIPLYPDAFNPSIIPWKGSYLLNFRYRDPLTGIPNLIGFTKLNKHFEPVGKVYPLKIQYEEPNLAGNLIQDPRMIAVGEQIYIIYSNKWQLPFELVHRVFISPLVFDGKQFIATHPEVYLDFDGLVGRKFEKNWTPFEYAGNLLLAYTINPHKIFMPIFGKKRCVTIACSEMSASWQWGEFRGGSPALVVGDQYLAFCHSTTVMASKHTDGKPMQHYFMGAYTFAKEPPFSLISISPQFIVDKGFYSEPYYHTWKPLRVVFPCGFVFDDSTITVSFGRQDYEMWIVQFDREKFFENLVPVQPVN